MDIYQAALKRLRREKRSYLELERLSSIPDETLRDICKFPKRSPQLKTVQRIVKFYEREDKIQ